MELIDKRNLEIGGAALPMKSNKPVRRGWRNLWTATPFLLPSLFLFVVFFFYPMFKTIYLSFYLTNARGDAKQWVGWLQYKEMLTSPEFHNSLMVTLTFVILTVVPGILLALFLALLVSKPIRGITFFRTLIISPVTVSVATASTIGLLLFNPSVSIITYALRIFGVKEIAWLTDPFWAMIAVSMVTIWLGVGFNTIILLGGLQSIPNEILESSLIDGAGFWCRLRHVILPLLSPSLFFVLIVSVIGAFQSFGQVNILTQGGPSGATNLIVYSIYRNAFFNFQFGYASAQSIALFLIILTLTMIQFLVVERKVHYQ
ncbi:carbohydrate ABC transporter permease [Effusibacillus pohliae]|uniref:carbohydrate ABC transporter permease n=1 Tax=Effusibacillus pohliae TaxID=232270 RepID=UPI000376AF30|nr:sugar ABC transporter permease [Effusibacillus pohliae]